MAPRPPFSDTTPVVYQGNGRKMPKHGITGDGKQKTTVDKVLVNGEEWRRGVQQNIVFIFKNLKLLDF